MTFRRILGAAVLVEVPFATAAQATNYPLSIENCGQTLVFQAAPERAVTIGQSTTEMLYALGLADRVQGTSVWFNDVLPEFAQANAGVERLADNHPGFEAVMAREPQLVTTQFEFHVGAQGVVGTRDQFNELGAQVYAMPADCVGKDNMVGGDGARTREFSIELMYRAVRELAQIFDVEARWPDVALAVPVSVVGVLLCHTQVRTLDAFTFGTESAVAMGVPVRRTQAMLIAVVTMLTATMVSIVGAIGFVGLVIPHAARFLVGVRHARLLPASAVIGAVFLVLADTVSEWRGWPGAIGTACRGASGSAFIWRARWPRILASCCWTNRRTTWISTTSCPSCGWCAAWGSRRWWRCMI